MPINSPANSRSNPRAFWVGLALLGLLPLSLLLALAWGSSGWVWPWLATETQSDLIWALRWPRAIAAWITGALLAVAGCLMQVLLRNPLADPYVLGLSGGASVFALLGISVAGTLGIQTVPIPALAFLGALLTTIIVFVLARGKGPWSTTRVLLTGVVIAAGWGAVISLILALGPDASLRGMLFWMMGDLSYAGLSAWWLVAVFVGLVLVWFRARSLNVMSQGELQASLLGEGTRARFWEVYVLASLLTGLAVSIAGAIGFVGLIVPHLMRLVLGADHRVLLPAAAFFGGGFLVIADTIARTLLAPRQLPVGVLTALIGVPLFLVLLNRAIRIRG